MEKEITSATTHKRDFFSLLYVLYLTFVATIKNELQTVKKWEEWPTDSHFPKNILGKPKSLWRFFFFKKQGKFSVVLRFMKLEDEGGEVEQYVTNEVELIKAWAWWQDENWGFPLGGQKCPKIWKRAKEVVITKCDYSPSSSSPFISTKQHHNNDL